MRYILFMLGLISAFVAHAEPVRIAVAANFKHTLDQLIAAYPAKHTKFAVSAGATGMLYAQIVQGAPFDVFFAADEERPTRLEREKRAVQGSRFTYASGQLALWAPSSRNLTSISQALASARVVAIADPKVAPYGVAAEQVLRKIDPDRSATFKLVRGESIGQTFQFIATGHADAGFIALSQVEEAPNAEVIRAQSLRVNPALHTPLQQQVVLLSTSTNKEEAGAFLRFIRTEAARTIIERSGYSVHQPQHR